MKITSLRQSMPEVNRIYFRHELIAGFGQIVNACPSDKGLEGKVYYFNHRPCLDHLGHLLPSRPLSSNQRSEDSDSQPLDAESWSQVGEVNRPLIEEGPDFSSTTEQIDVSIEPPTPREEVKALEETSSPEQSQALELLLKYSGDYVSDFIEHQLSVPEPPRHVRQVECLCQYVEKRIVPIRTREEV